MSAPAAAQAAARVVGLVKRFGATCALDGISAQLPAGMILGLVGPDGAGKTTLIRLFAGLMEPSAGTVEVLGRPPRAQGGTTQAETGYMPQRFGLYEDLSVLDNLNLYANLRALESEARRQRFARAVEIHRAERLYRAARGAAVRRDEAETRARLRTARPPAAAAAR